MFLTERASIVPNALKMCDADAITSDSSSRSLENSKQSEMRKYWFL